jgi:hypothetical protein
MLKRDPAGEDCFAMKILTREEAAELLGGKPLDIFVSEQSSRMRLVNAAYSTPRDSGRKTALSRLFAYMLGRSTDVCVYISLWGVWVENLDLFYGYRRSFGESRTLMEAPVHVFSLSEQDAFVSILSMVFYFLWDATVFDIEGKALVRISHDEWIEVFTAADELNREFATELEKYGLRTLAP